MVKNLPAKQEMLVHSWVWQDPLEKEIAVPSSILSWRIHGQRNLVGYSLWGGKESIRTEGVSTYTHSFNLVYQLCLGMAVYKRNNVLM